jgi:hypothetical protein
LTYECRGRAFRVQGRCPRRDQRSGMVKLHRCALNVNGSVQLLWCVGCRWPKERSIRITVSLLLALWHISGVNESPAPKYFDAILVFNASNDTADSRRHAVGACAATLKR